MSFTSASCEFKQSNIRGRSLMQGPRPPPLRVSDSSSTIKKSSQNNIRNRISSNIIINKKKNVINPVIIYLRSPKIIHVRPEEFMSLVQRLTGKDSVSRDGPCNRPPTLSSWNVTGDDADAHRDESMVAVVRAGVTKRSSSSGNSFDAEMSKLAFNGVEDSDQILDLSPTRQRFLACI